MRADPRQAFTHLNQLKLELNLGGFSGELLYWGFFDGATWWRNYLHVHSFFEVCYAFEGAGEFHVDGQLHKVKKGDLFIAKPDERHEIIASETDPLGIYFWSYTLVPSGQALSSDLARLFNDLANSHESVVSPSPSTAQILDLLTKEAAHLRAGYPCVVQGLTKQLLIETARAFTPASAPSQPTGGLSPMHSGVVVDTVMRYLRDNCGQALRLKEIAAQVHLSERHVGRLFKVATGVSVKQYATRLKMDTAKQLLLNQALSISDVAYETGYHDVRHFGTVFRKYTGSSPSSYRKEGGTRFV